jgi:hypothetical protein
MSGVWRQSHISQLNTSNAFCVTPQIRKHLDNPLLRFLRAEIHEKKNIEMCRIYFNTKIFKRRRKKTFFLRMRRYCWKWKRIICKRVEKKEGKNLEKLTLNLSLNEIYFLCNSIKRTPTVLCNRFDPFRLLFIFLLWQLYNNIVRSFALEIETKTW